MKIEQGQYNNIHESVQFLPLVDDPGPVVIGDCNTIHENVKIVVGEAGFRMGDWNTIHNDVFIMDDVEMGHNCWIGQGTHLDGRGKLRIGNGVTIGFNCHIWSHVTRGCLIDGCLLHGNERTIIEDDVWLVGSNVTVNMGITLERRSIVYAHSVVAHNTLEECTYGGIPAVRIWGHDYWSEPDEFTKFNMMLLWGKEFVAEKNDEGLKLTKTTEKSFNISHRWSCEALMIGLRGVLFSHEDVTAFNLTDMTYTKRLTNLEREFIAFLKDYKARFIPV